MDNRKPTIFALTAMILWGLSFPLNRICLQYFPIIELAFIKYGIASIFLIGASIIMKARLPHPKDIPLFILAGFIGITLYNISLNQGLTSVTSATSGMIMASSPIMIVFLSRLLLKEKLQKKLWFPILFQFLGVVIISVFDGILTLNIGIIWIIMATLVSSLYAIVQRMLQRYRPVEVMTYSVVIGTTFLFVAAPTSIQVLLDAPKDMFYLVIAFGIGIVFFSNFLWGYAIRMSHSMNAMGNLLFLPSVFATIFGAIITKEIPSISTLIGGTIIIIGSFIFNHIKMKLAAEKLQEENNKK